MPNPISQSELDAYDLSLAEFRINGDPMWGPEIRYPERRWRATVREKDREIAELKAQLKASSPS